MMRENALTGVLANKETTPAAAHHVDANEFENAGAGWLIGAVCGFGGGILTPIIGFVLSTVGYFTANAANINVIGNWLTFAMIPLLMFGAYSLDRIETIAKANERKRVEGKH